MPIRHCRALVQPQTADAETREVDVVFATERPIPTFGWEEEYDEVLVCTPEAVCMERAERGLPVMDCHNTSSVFNQIGRTVNVWFNDKRELCARIRFSERAEVVELFKDIVSGIVKDISVGYVIYKYEREEREGQRPIYRAVYWMPTELSFAPVQADIGSEVRAGREQYTVEIINKTTSMGTISKKRKVEEGKTVEYVVEGDPVKAGDKVITDDVTGIALQDGEAGDTVTLSLIETEPAGEPTDSTPSAGTEKPAEPAQRSAANPDDKARMDAILVSTRAANLNDTFAIELFRSSKTLEECRQAVIEKAIRSSTQINGTHGIEVGAAGIDKKREAVQEAILNRVQPSRFKLSEGAREFRGMTLYEMSKELLMERGVNVRGKSKAELADMIFGKRSVSSSDLPLIFEGVIDKMLRTDSEFAPEFWNKIARQTTLSDFRSKNLYQFGSRNGMKEVAEGEEIKFTTLVEGKESIRLKSYAEGIAVTRQAYINDDLSVFDKIPSLFVKDWDELRGDLVWGLIINNVAMSDGKALFHTDHCNILSGADSALSEKSLAEAKVRMSKQKSIDGRIIRIMPKFLIVPPELEITARKLITSITPAKSEDVNVFANAFDIIVEPRLIKPTEWYLSADPNAVDSIYYAYLEGNESLRVNTKDDFNKDSITYLVRGDFGASVIDYRGFVKSNGK